MKDISLVSNDGNYELNIYKSDDNVFINLFEYNNYNALFNYQCNTFITGNLILHLSKALEKFKSSSCTKMITSKWYPKFDKGKLINLVKYPSLFIVLERKIDKEIAYFTLQLNENTKIKFDTTVDYISHLFI